jgi:hypothetical protein
MPPADTSGLASRPSLCSQRLRAERNPCVRTRDAADSPGRVLACNAAGESVAEARHDFAWRGSEHEAGVRERASAIPRNGRQETSPQIQRSRVDPETGRVPSRSGSPWLHASAHKWKASRRSAASSRHRSCRGFGGWRRTVGTPSFFAAPTDRQSLITRAVPCGVQTKSRQFREGRDSSLATAGPKVLTASLFHPAQRRPWIEPALSGDEGGEAEDRGGAAVPHFATGRRPSDSATCPGKPAAQRPASAKNSCHSTGREATTVIKKPKHFPRGCSQGGNTRPGALLGETP